MSAATLPASSIFSCRRPHCRIVVHVRYGPGSLQTIVEGNGSVTIGANVDIDGGTTGTIQITANADGSDTGDLLDIDASAWYAELAMRLERLLPGAPSLRYRYGRFSGDDDPADTTSRGYDPFFYGPTPNRGAPYGTWYQGEIVGEYLLFNTNLRAHMLHLNFWLEPGSRGKELSLGLIYYHFLLDAKQSKSFVAGQIDRVLNKH